MNTEDIRNEIPYIEDIEATDIKVLFGYIIQRLDIIEEEIQDLKDSLDS